MSSTASRPPDPPPSAPPADHDLDETIGRKWSVDSAAAQGTRDDGTRVAGNRAQRTARTIRRRRRRMIRVILLAAGLLVLAGGVIVADAYYQSYRIYETAKGVIPQLRVVRSSLAAGQVPPSQSLQAASDLTARAEKLVRNTRFTFRFTGALPYLGRPIAAVRLGVSAVGEEARAAAAMRDILSEVLGPSAQTGPNQSQPSPIFHRGAIDVKLIASLTPRLEAAIGHLATADRDIRAMPYIPLLSGRLDRLQTDALAQSTKALNLANRALAGARLLPSFLGADRPKTYYLAMQNNSDQRATGGAVLAYGMITVDQGKFRLVDGGSIIPIDRARGFHGVRIPPEIAWYLQNKPGQRALRLASLNLTPDFPVVARTWATILQTSTGRRIDGVFALDPIAISELMGKRTIRVPSYAGPINAGNVVRVVENDQYRLPQSDQKAFPGQLIAAAWPLFSNPEPLLPMLQGLGRALSEKHLQIWSADLRLEGLLRRLDWDGRLSVLPGDYLYVTDSKVLLNKVDFYTYTSIIYKVTVDRSGAVRANCQITLVNRTPPGQPFPISGRPPRRSVVNRALISLYVPKEAQLRPNALPAGPRTHAEDGANVFTKVVQSLPRRPGTATFTYAIPGVILTTPAGKVYRLTVQHQPMVNPIDLEVVVTLPSGQSIRSAAGWTVNGNVALFHTELTRDLVTQILF